VPIAELQSPEPKIKFFCVQCGQKIYVPQKYQGRKCKCPKCNAGSVVPLQEAHNKQDVIKQKYTPEPVEIDELVLAPLEEEPRRELPASIPRPSSNYNSQDNVIQESFPKWLIAVIVIALLIPIVMVCSIVWNKTVGETMRENRRVEEYRVAAEQREAQKKAEERRVAAAEREEENRRIAEREKQLAAAKTNETTKEINSSRTVTQSEIDFYNAINPTMKQLVHINNGLSEGMLNYQSFNEAVRKLMEVVEECSAWTAANRHRFEKGLDSRLAESMIQAINAQDSYIKVDKYWNKMIINASNEILVIELERGRDFNLQMGIMHGDAATFAYNSYAKREPFELAKEKYEEKQKKILAYLESYKEKL
jgi:DNA-directed RNA polymerase subunit M/transcription elongation factor TFIIS